MRARRTVDSNKVFSLRGGTEDNDLWVELCADAQGNPLIQSTWVPTDEERKAIVEGANIMLNVWGHEHPPVALTLTTVKIGKRHSPDE